jgi:hypothetical protein
MHEDQQPLALAVAVVADLVPLVAELAHGAILIAQEAGAAEVGPDPLHSLLRVAEGPVDFLLRSFSSLERALVRLTSSSDFLL